MNSAWESSFISVFNDLAKQAAYALTAPWQASNRYVQ
jgi:hypothetical protein